MNFILRDVEHYKGWFVIVGVTLIMCTIHVCCFNDLGLGPDNFITNKLLRQIKIFSNPKMRQDSRQRKPKRIKQT